MSTKLAEYIASAGLTQAEFSRQTGIPQPMVCQWSCGKRRPGLASALAIEKATGGKIPASYWTTVDAENNRRPAKRVRRKASL